MWFWFKRQLTRQNKPSSFLSFWNLILLKFMIGWWKVFFYPIFTQPNEAIENLYACSFFQLVIQAQDLFILGYFQRESTSTSFDFIGLGLELFPFDVDIDSCRFVFETFFNVLILCDFKISYVYKLLLNQYLSDWVITKSTTWYSWFLMNQYDDMRWIEHF
jgi:hypothetical protein